MKLSKALNGPIPGENYLADTKNYPWHRPPDMADYVDIVTEIHKRLTKPQAIGQLRVMLAAGETILDYVTGNLRIAVGEGKMPIDMAVLAAGPMARMVEVICEQGNFDYERGWEQDEPIPTVAKARAMAGLNDKPRVPTLPEKPVPDAAAPKEAPVEGGFMDSPNGPAPKDEQSVMLGQAG